MQRPSAAKPVPRKVNPTPTPGPEPEPEPHEPEPTPAPAPGPAPEPEPAPAPAPPAKAEQPVAPPLGDPTAQPVPPPGPAPSVDAGVSVDPNLPPATARPGPPGTGMIFGGIALAGPGLVISAISLVGVAVSDPQSGPLLPAMLGVGGAMLVGGGVLTGFGFKRNIAYDRWIKQTGVRPPRSGHGVIVGGSLMAAAGVSIIAWQADVARRSPAGEVCNVDGCQTPRSEAAIGVAIGVLVLGGAATLLGLGIKKKLKYDAWMRAPVQPSFSLLPGGAGLSLSGRF